MVVGKLWLCVPPLKLTWWVDAAVIVAQLAWNCGTTLKVFMRCLCIVHV